MIEKHYFFLSGKLASLQKAKLVFNNPTELAFYQIVNFIKDSFKIGNLCLMNFSEDKLGRY
jgi:hypothetical protein